MRKATGGEITRPGITKFAMMFLPLLSMRKKKLQHMFISGTQMNYSLSITQMNYSLSITDVGKKV